jgi:hypothetical protein
MMNFIFWILSFELIILINFVDKMDYYYFGKFGENLEIWIFEKLKLREVTSNSVHLHGGWEVSINGSHSSAG